MATLRTRRRGISFPLKITEDGSLKTSTDIDLLRDRIMSVLLTRKFERIMRPNYGIREYTFESRPTIRPVTEGIRLALKKQIPEVDNFEVFAGFQSNVETKTLRVQINWGVSKIPQPPINFYLDY